jgi:hypothetical protein
VELTTLPSFDVEFKIRVEVQHFIPLGVLITSQRRFIFYQKAEQSLTSSAEIDKQSDAY